MSELSTRTKYVTGVIRLKNDLSLNHIFAFDKYIKSVSCEYFYIIHDSDKDSKGVLIPRHIHFVAILNRTPRLSTVLSEICRALDINEFAVSISKTINDSGAIRYLIHKDDTDKFPYDSSKIVTNVSTDRLNEYLNTVPSSKLDVSTIVEICLRCNSLLDVISYLGLNNYNMFRNVIRDIYTETHITDYKR